MWGSFEKRVTAGMVAALWLCWMVLQCVWQMWTQWPLLPDPPSRARTLPLHRARHILDPFSTNIPGGFGPVKELRNPFYPNPSQPAPQPVPVVTRQVELVYQGYYATSQGQKRAYVRSGTQLIIGGVGTVVVSDYAIADISPRQLVLANPSGKRVSLEFTIGKKIEVPP